MSTPDQLSPPAPAANEFVSASGSAFAGWRQGMQDALEIANSAQVREDSHNTAAGVQVCIVLAIQKKLNCNSAIQCPRCEGTGKYTALFGGESDCSLCDGIGIAPQFIPDVNMMGLSPWQEEAPDDDAVCVRCGDEGRVPVHEYDAQVGETWRTCPECHGTTEGCAR